MDCRVCGERVPEDRIAMNPRVVTCSPACSQAHGKRLRRENSRRHYAMHREAYKAARKAAKG